MDAPQDSLNPLVAQVDPDFEDCEPEIDDSVKCCPDCERPNQFGEQCEACRRDEQEEIAREEYEAGLRDDSPALPAPWWEAR